MPQTTYSWDTPVASAGALVDLTPHVVDSRLNETGTTLLPGMGVVKGTAAGKQVKLPVSGSLAGDFEGVVMNDGSRELDASGNVVIPLKGALSVLVKGRVYVRLKSTITPAYGDDLYLITSGANVGLFTKSDDSAETNKVAVATGKYLGAKGSTNVAPVSIG